MAGMPSLLFHMYRQCRFRSCGLAELFSFLSAAATFASSGTAAGSEDDNGDSISGDNIPESPTDAPAGTIIPKGVAEAEFWPECWWPPPASNCSTSLEDASDGPGLGKKFADLWRDERVACERAGERAW